jgi:hypothetical protein
MLKTTMKPQVAASTETCVNSRFDSAKPLFIGSIPIAASNHNLNDTASLAGHAGYRQQGESVQKEP